MQADARLGENDSELFVCPECGDLGCGAVVAEIDVSDETVTWRAFRFVQDGDAPDDQWPIDVPGEPFVFDRTAYEQVLADAESELAPRDDSGHGAD